MKLSLIFLLIFFITSVSGAQQSLGNFELNQEIQLVQNCQNSTYSNLSRIIFPANQDDRIFSLNEEKVMTKSGFNYNFSYSDTPYLGQYIVYGHCDEFGADTAWVYDFEISQNGSSLNQFPIPIFVFLISVVLIIVGYSKRELRMFKVVGSVLMMVFGVYTIYPGYAGLSSHDILGWSIAIVALGSGGYFLFSDFFEEDYQRDEYYNYEGDVVDG